MQEITFSDNRAEAFLVGPPTTSDSADNGSRTRIAITLHDQGRTAKIKVSGQSISLREGEFSEWVRVHFRAGVWRKVYGICQFRWTRNKENFRLYVTPVQIDPERPALPVSHPPYYSIHLAKLQGPFATLGLAEDTWARNEKILDDDAFLEQAYSIHAEREQMFIESVKRIRKGLCVCVFDAPDRIQHMFLQTAHDSGSQPGNELETSYDEIIDQMYIRMDNLVGRLHRMTGRKDVLLVISDHGFSTFRRGVNLNAWMREHRYLRTRTGCEATQYLQGIDWGNTRAYTFGLSGIYLNRSGREKQGIVAPGEADPLKEELIRQLETLVDEETGQNPIRRVYDAATTYEGAYRDDGPDLIVGYADGYRASWEAAVGRADGPVFSDNNKAWRGDHCVDPEIVPGVLFANRDVKTSGDIQLMDIGPTILELFGITPPAYMDGKAVPLGHPTSASDLK